MSNLRGRRLYPDLAYVKKRNAQETQIEHLVGQSFKLVFYSIIAVLVYFMYPGGFPIDVNSLFWSGASVAEIFASTWYVFAWAFFSALMYGWAKKHDRSDRAFATDIYGSKMGIAIQAGVLEEINYRYLLFIINIGWLPVFDWLLFGWGDGSGLVEWVYTNVLIPVVDWLTFGAMTNLLVTVPWFIGGAVIAANAVFRDGHKYQGPFGTLNSWYIGMFLFWCMFEYGLIAAIIVHTIYDAIIFTTNHFDVLWDTRRDSL